MLNDDREKAVQAVAEDSGQKSWIEKTPGVCGGRACVRRRRIPVWQLVESRKLGSTDEYLLGIYEPPLTPADLAVTWEYYQIHREEIERDIWENQACMIDKTVQNIPAWFLVRGRQLGFPDAELCEAFDPPLTSDELQAAWQYAATHAGEIQHSLAHEVEPY